MRQGRHGFAAIVAAAAGNEEEDEEATSKAVAVRAARLGGAPHARTSRCCSRPWKRCCAFVHPLERASVGTHCFGFMAFAVFLVVRIALAAKAAAPHGIDPFTMIQIAAIAVSTAVFGASAAYHSSSKSVCLSAYLLALDRALVYTSIVSSGAADFVIATMGTATPLTACALSAPLLPDPAVPWQAYSDLPLAGGIAVISVVAVRVTRWPTDTSGQNGFDHPSGIDSRRPGHIAGPFGATYAVLAGVCALAWICTTDYELRMFPGGVGATVISVKAVSTTAALLLGANDVHETTDAYATCLPIALRKCLPRSHTLWHVVALAVATSAIGVREWALAAQIEASAACAYRAASER